jgi:hypothetical protein
LTCPLLRRPRSASQIAFGGRRSTPTVDQFPWCSAWCCGARHQRHPPIFSLEVVLHSMASRQGGSNAHSCRSRGPPRLSLQFGMRVEHGRRRARHGLLQRRRGGCGALIKPRADQVKRGDANALASTWLCGPARRAAAAWPAARRRRLRARARVRAGPRPLVARPLLILLPPLLLVLAARPVLLLLPVFLLLLALVAGGALALLMGGMQVGGGGGRVGGGNRWVRVSVGEVRYLSKGPLSHPLPT